MTSDKFPWELLKAECLRLVCAQLVEASSTEGGQNSFKPGRKEDMVAFLRDVNERGVNKALEDVAPPRKTTVVSTTLQASPSKRKNAHVDDDDDDEDMEDDSDNKNGEEGYNTRYKGVKRVKVHEERPEPQSKRRVSRPRKSASEGGGGVVVEGARKRGRPRKDASTSVVGGAQNNVSPSKGKGKSLENGDDVGVVVLPSISSRPRGRPRKNVSGVPPESAKKPLQSTSANGAPKSKDSSGREVFDGIVLVKRNKNQKENVVGDDGEGPNDERNDGLEEDAVIAAVNGDAQGDLSSLGGSNKENEHEISATYTPDPEEGHDIDADGEFEADAEVLV